MLSRRRVTILNKKKFFNSTRRHLARKSIHQKIIARRKQFALEQLEEADAII